MSSTSASCERHLEAGRRALSLGDVATADTEMSAAIAAAESEGADAELLAAALGARAQFLYQSKRYAEAAPLFRRALDVRERIEGAESPSLVPALHNVAATHLALGDSIGAEPLLRRALSLLERVHGEEHPELAGVLNGLSQLYLKRGAHAEAEPLVRRLLAILRARGEERPEVATVMASLASVHHALSEHEAAERLLRRVLEIRERTLAPNHFAIATTLEALAETCATRGKLDEALALLERALDMRERTQGAAHPSLAVVRAKIADLQLQLSQDAFAVPLMEPAVEPRIETPPPPLALESPRISQPVARAPQTAPATPPSAPSRPRPLTEFHPGVAPAASLPPADAARREDGAFDAIRRLAAELNGSPAAGDAALAERNGDSALAVSILPTGGALVLPGADRAVAASDREEHLDDDEFASDDWTLAARRTSIFARPMVRLGLGAAALVAVAVPTVLAMRSADAGDGFVSSTPDASGTTSTGQQTLGGSVALPPVLDSGTSSMAGADSGRASAREPRDGASASGSSQRDTRNAARAATPTRTAASESRSAEPTPPAAVPLPTPGRLPGGIDVSVDASLPTVQVGGAAADSRGALEELRGATKAASTPYGGTRGFTPAALLGNQPAPRYPDELRRDRLRGEVTVTFTVTANGRVDANTFRVLRASDMRFVASVSALLPQLRFVPAERDGVPVAQTVEMNFRFEPPRD